MTSVNSIDCIAYGVRMRLVAGSDDLFAELPKLLPYGTEIVAGSGPDTEADTQIFSLLPSAEGRGLRCCSGADIVLESHDIQAVFDALAGALMVHVANYAAERVFVHAGVVAWHGRALVLPGSSFAGKSTLTAALVRAGATYYSDEYAVLDTQGYVHPYARDLSLRDGISTKQHSMPVAHLGGTAGTSRLPVSLVVFTHYRRDAQWSPQSVSPGMAALEMLKHAIPIQRTPARVMSTLSQMLGAATAWASPRGEADVLVRELLEWLSTDPSQPPSLLMNARVPA